MHGLEHKSASSLYGKVNSNAGLLFSDCATYENKKIGLSAYEAWYFVASAIRAILPGLGSVVDQVRDTVECDFVANRLCCTNRSL